jgi:hypothetical protein
VRKDGSPVAPRDELQLEAGASFVLSIGPARFVRIEGAGPGKGKPRRP